MKQSSVLIVFVVVTLLKILYTEAHFKHRNMDTSLSSPLGFQEISGLSTFGQTDLKTSLAVQKTIAFMTILTSHPKLLCIVPPFLIVDFLTQLSCNPAILQAIPPNMLMGFMTSLKNVPTLTNTIPQSLFVSISNTLSIGTPGVTGTGPVESPRPEVIPTTLPGASINSEVAGVITPSAPSTGPAPNLPGISVTNEVAASISPAVPSSGPAPNVPGISVTKDVAASISPAVPSSGPAPNLPGISVTKDVAASISPAVPSSGPGPNLPGVSVTKDVAASISPAVPSSGPGPNLPGVTVTKDVTASITPISPPPVAPILPADLPTTDGIPPNAYPPAEPSVPCIEVPAIGSPPKLPGILPMPTPSLSPLSILTSLFNKGSGNSLLEAKIEAILRLFASGNFKLPQIHLPEVGSTLPTKPIIPVKPHPSQVFILLPAPVIGKPEIPSSQATKLYYKPGSLNQILDFLHQRLFTPPQKLALPKPNLPKLNLQKLSLPKPIPQFPAVPGHASPIKCLPIFSKVPC
ncbi:hypothetical protein QTP88_017311 [Uroleucon formosanum]